MSSRGGGKTVLRTHVTWWSRQLLDNPKKFYTQDDLRLGKILMSGNIRCVEPIKAFFSSSNAAPFFFIRRFFYGFPYTLISGQRWIMVQFFLCSVQRQGGGGRGEREIVIWFWILCEGRMMMAGSMNFGGKSICYLDSILYLRCFICRQRFEGQFSGSTEER